MTRILSYFQTVKLKFDFDFYGQTLNEITIASNGALLTGSKSAEIDLPNHIAPFLSNLPPSEDDSIIYTNDGMENFFLKFHCIANMILKCGFVV